MSVLLVWGSSLTDKLAWPGAINGLPELLWKPSPNHYLTRLDPKGIVIHETEGAYASAVSWFSQTRSQVSAHLVLKEDGTEASQCVSWRLPAWHAVNANGHTLGIELAGFTAEPNDPAQLRAAARIVGFFCHKFNILPRQGDPHGFGGIVRHRDLGAYGGNHGDPGGFDWQQFIHDCAVQVARGGYRTVWGLGS